MKYLKLIPILLIYLLAMPVSALPLLENLDGVERYTDLGSGQRPYGG